PLQSVRPSEVRSLARVSGKHPCHGRTPSVKEQSAAIRASEQLGVLAWWSHLLRIPFIRSIDDLALTSDIPVNEHGPDGHQGMPHRGALDDRLDCRSGDPEPAQPEDG